MTRPFSTLVLAFVLAACGASPTQTRPAAPPADNFDDMNHEERLVFMRDVVMPKTKELFVKFDPKYADMDCKTCHGKKAADGHFDLPNAEIKVLPGTEEAFVAWVSKDANEMRYTKFMAGELEPLMAQLLHRKAFDPKTGDGDFSCNNCHLLDPPQPPKPHGHHDHGGHDGHDDRDHDHGGHGT